jgi:Ca-activated chloride channel family protein
MRPLITAALAALAATVLAAQQPTFRAGSGVTVSLPTIVLDREGRISPDLEQDQFTVLDNGKPQPITIFQNSAEPFTVVTMLDFSASMTGNLERLKAATEQFILRLLPADKGQVGAFSDKIQFSGTFTSDRDDLIGALDDLQFGNPTRLYDAAYASIDELKEVQGRKVVLLFTDGDDTASRLGAGDVADSARDRDVMIYAIGLSSEYFDGICRRSTRPDRGLKKLAEETGGGYFELKKADELASTFTRVAQELHSLYTIGFVAPVLDGKEHRVEVKMKQPGMTARTRRTYIASQDKLGER